MATRMSARHWADVLELRPEVIMVGTAVELIDEAGKVLGREPHVAMHEDIFTVTAYFHALRHSSIMFRRELLERVQYRGVLGANDHDFFARTAEVGRVEVLPAPLCRYRLRFDSISHVGDKGAISRALVCMLTHRRRRGLPEEYDFWANKFSAAEAEIHYGQRNRDAMNRARATDNRLGQPAFLFVFLDPGRVRRRVRKFERIRRTDTRIRFAERIFVQ